MKKCILLFFTLFLLSVLTFYSWFSLTSGEHHYKHDDLFSYWLYTPDVLKNVPLISKDVEYSYNYDLDHQQTTVIITWRHIDNLPEKKSNLIDFLQRPGVSIKYDCLWIYHDQRDYADNYQRYCVYQKGDSLELEYIETVK